MVPLCLDLKNSQNQRPDPRRSILARRDRTNIQHLHPELWIVFALDASKFLATVIPRLQQNGTNSS